MNKVIVNNSTFILNFVLNSYIEIFIITRVYIQNFFYSNNLNI